MCIFVIMFDFDLYLLIYLSWFLQVQINFNLGCLVIFGSYGKGDEICFKCDNYQVIVVWDLNIECDFGVKGFFVSILGCYDIIVLGS